ncbi:MAG: alpha/beta hydrolase [Verrucomicrobia subdivision 3 bacterium]|nr:alpha/beta hydrolase [Limisphaerales bacterium]
MDSAVVKRRVLKSLLLGTPGFLFLTYAAVRRAGMWRLYKPVCLAETQALRDVPYWDSDHPKHRLDLFVPTGANWPVLVFIHGGGLDSGDKALRVCGRDVYGNIGRFYACRGIGVAVINYRLQPQVTWREQVHDAARAVAWVHAHVGKFGGDAARLFAAGHSAGAYLAARVALDPAPLARLGLSRSIISGVITVSGAALDLTDARTYELGAKLRQYAKRFQCGDPTENWKREASPVAHAAAGAPPFLVMYASGEARCLQRQSQLLHEALQRNRVPSELVVVPGQSHRRIVLSLSRPDAVASVAILRFIEHKGRANSESEAA